MIWRNYPFLLRRHIPPYPPLPHRWDRCWPDPDSFVECVWPLLITIAYAGLLLGIVLRL